MSPKKNRKRSTRNSNNNIPGLEDVEMDQQFDHEEPDLMPISKQYATIINQNQQSKLGTMDSNYAETHQRPVRTS